MGWGDREGEGSAFFSEDPRPWLAPLLTVAALLSVGRLVAEVSSASGAPISTRIVLFSGLEALLPIGLVLAAALVALATLYVVRSGATATADDAAEFAGSSQ